MMDGAKNGEKRSEKRFRFMAGVMPAFF